MPLQRRTLLQHMLAGTAVSAAPAFAQQTANTLRIVVGYPAGATSDSLTRVVAEQMGKTLKQPVIVENKAGAGGRIGNEVVKAARARWQHLVDDTGGDDVDLSALVCRPVALRRVQGFRAGGAPEQLPDRAWP